MSTIFWLEEDGQPPSIRLVLLTESQLKTPPGRSQSDPASLRPGSHRELSFLGQGAQSAGQHVAGAQHVQRTALWKAILGACRAALHTDCDVFCLGVRDASASLAALCFGREVRRSKYTHFFPYKSDGDGKI